MLKLGRKEPKQGRSKETVDAIFTAVTHILDSEGADHLTTNKIAEKAGVSVGSLYQYFKNKESIFEGILHKLIDNNLTRFEKEFAKGPPKDVGEIINVFVRAEFENFFKMEKVSRTLLEYAPKVLSPEFFLKNDARIIKFLSEQIEIHKLEIAPKNKKEAFFLCTQAVRITIVMSFLKTPEERVIILDELIVMLTKYLRPTS